MSNSNIQTQVLDPLFDNEFDISKFYSFLKELLPDFKIIEKTFLFVMNTKNMLNQHNFVEIIGGIVKTH